MSLSQALKEAHLYNLQQMKNLGRKELAREQVKEWLDNQRKLKVKEAQKEAYKLWRNKTKTQ